MDDESKPPQPPAASPSDLARQGALPSVLARRPDLADEAADYARAREAPATTRAHKADWMVFERWCRLHDVAAMPAAIDTLVGFLVEEARTKATATVLRYVATIGKLHKLAGHPSPAADARVKEIVRGMKRTKGVGNPRAKEPLTGNLLAQYTEGLKRLSAEYHGARRTERDLAVLFFGHATALRRSELCALDVEDLSWTDVGVTVTVRRSKTDQFGKGRQVEAPRLDDLPTVCPVRALRAWLDGSGISTGPLFRGLMKGGGVRTERLTPGQVGAIVKRAVAFLDLDPKLFGGHSLRAGYVTDARTAGKDWGEIMDQTGHRKVETVRLYARGETSRFKAAHVADVLTAAFSNRFSSHLAWQDLAGGGVKIARVGLPPPTPALVECFREGGLDHRKLCASAAAWLDREGRGWRHPGPDSPGGLADLVSRDGKLFVEAGDTSLDKVVEALRNGVEVLLVPYGFGGVVGFLVTGTVPDDAPRLRAALAKAFEVPK